MITIGAPVHARGWILRDWFDALAVQEDFPSDQLSILLNYGPSDDDTLAIIEAEDRFADVDWLVDTEHQHVGKRVWTLDRYKTMADLRNALLSEVRRTQPDFYLSCDTDMLLPPHTLRTLLADMGDFQGVAPLTFMTPAGEGCPNSMNMDGTRSFSPGVTQQYAVFGVVLMTSALYSNVDYEAHGLGEDLGWAKNAWAKQMSLALTTNVRVKHVMHPGMLGSLDPRVGF